MNVAKWPPHLRPKQPNAVTREGRRCLRIEPRPIIYLFIFFRFWICADLRQFGFDARQTGPIRAESDCIGRISVCVGRQKEIDWREKKKKNLKPKIPVDLVRRCHRLHWP